MSGRRIISAILTGIMGTLLLAGGGAVHAQERPGQALSESEWNYIQEKERLKVAVVDDWAPISLRKDDSGAFSGLAVDILQRLEINTGLKVEFVPAENYLNALALTQAGETDLTAVFLKYPNTGIQELDATEPYLQSDLLIVYQEETDLKQLSSYNFAKVEGCPPISKRQGISYLEFKTPSECFLALRTGQVDMLYCNVYTGMDYIQQYENRTLSAIPVEIEATFSFGVPKDAKILKDLLDGAIASMSRSEISTSLTRNSMSSEQGVLNFVYSHPVKVICVIISVAFLAILSTILYVRTKGRHLLNQLEYEKSYCMLADTVGGIGINYDCAEDKLRLLGKYAAQISLPKEIPNFSDYLEREDRETSLTKDRFIQMLAAGADGTLYETVLKCKLVNGAWAHFQVVFSVLATDAAYTRPIELYGYMTNVEEVYQEKEALLKMGFYDSVSTLYSRAGATAELDKRLKTATDCTADVLLIIDIDEFKKYNDTYGHDCGDDVLRQVGEHLKQLFRQGDVLCRWGGDEFFLYLMGMADHIDQVEARCAALQTVLQEYCYKGRKLPVTVSVGGVIRGPRSMDEAFQAADQALYIVKKRGRDGVYIMSNQENAPAEEP